MSEFKTKIIAFSLIALSALAFADTPKVDARGNNLVEGETAGVPNSNSSSNIGNTIGNTVGNTIGNQINDATGGLYNTINDVTGGKIGDTINGITTGVTNQIGNTINDVAGQIGGNLQGAVGSTITNAIGNIGNGVLGKYLGGSSNGGFTLNTLLQYLNSSYEIGIGNDYLKATCSIDAFDISDAGICGSVDKIEGKIRGILNKKLNIGICSIGSNKAKACGNEYLRGFCSNLVRKAKNTEIGDMGDIANNPLSGILGEADKYLSVTRGVHSTGARCSIDSTSSSSGSSGSSGGTSSGGSSNSGSKSKGVKNAYGEDTNEKMNDFAKVYSIFIERQGNSDSETAQFITRCMKLAPKNSYMSDSGEVDSDGLLKLYEACKPENYSRPSASEIHENRQVIAKFLQDESTSPDMSYGKKMERSAEMQQFLFNQCNNKNSLAEAKLCETNLKNSKSDVFGSTSNELTRQLANIEQYSAMLLAANEISNIDKLKDTSEESLKQILPTQRGPFLNRALKIDNEMAIQNAFAFKLSEAKQELARLSFQKMQDCAVPFYAAAAANEIKTMIDNAKANADATVTDILNK